jgi:tRNA1(Val) A37 N6-methylase TrmN6
MIADRDRPATSEDAVLGGRLRLRQRLTGHRVGHDAILLAAATEACAGEHAVDLGAGVGGAGLALARRVDGLRVTLVEIDAALAALAAENAGLNGLDARVDVRICDAEDCDALAAAGLAAGDADGVLMNPPFRDAARHNLSPDAARRLAHAAAPGLLSRWISTAGWLLRPGGALTLIWHAGARDDVLAAIGSAFGAAAVLPVYPRPGRAAIRVLVRATKGGQGAPVELPGLMLNDAQGRPTAAAEAVLREARPLALAAR